ncbi:hypothetical protein [Sphingomonas sp. Leaf412]|uniref:hypothetical protein n=1 Tax=Sphingomonas sp. Leaf412 TaxID=1736370 RepID=UPI0012E3BC91|nr:hypothetical protein [Sphingomonas sp. Leaf412]
MDVVTRIGGVQPVQRRRPLHREPVAIICAVRAAHQDRERQVAQREQRRIARMPCHHRRRGEPVGHPGRQLPDPVSAGRVPHQVDLVRVDAVQRHLIVDQPLEHGVDMRLMPQVPRVGGRARREIYPLRRGVETDLVRPLLVVQFRGSVAAAVHRNPQAAVAERCIAEGTRLPSQRLSVHDQRLGGDLAPPAVDQFLQPRGGQDMQGLGGCRAIERRRHERGVGLSRRGHARHPIL